MAESGVTGGLEPLSRSLCPPAHPQGPPSCLLLQAGPWSLGPKGARAADVGDPGHTMGPGRPECPVGSRVFKAPGRGACASWDRGAVCPPPLRGFSAVSGRRASGALGVCVCFPVGPGKHVPPSRLVRTRTEGERPSCCEGGLGVTEIKWCVCFRLPPVLVLPNLR